MSIDVKMPELYTTDLSKYSGIKDETLSLFADMKSTAAADIAAESTRCDGLHARATYMLRYVNNCFDIVLTPSLCQVSREDSLIRTMYDPCLYSAITRDNIAGGAMRNYFYRIRLDLRSYLGTR